MVLRFFPAETGHSILRSLKIGSTFSRLATRNFSTLPPFLFFPPVKEEEISANQKPLTLRFFNPAEIKFLYLTNRKLPQGISGLQYVLPLDGWVLSKRVVFIWPTWSLPILSPEIIPLPFAVRNPRCLLFDSLWDYLHFQRWKHPWNDMDVHKIDISSSPSDANCTVMALTSCGLLTFCRVGDSYWTDLGNQFLSELEDIILF